MWALPLIAFVAASLAALVRWWPILALEAGGAMESDGHLYFTVARGLLNGYMPWTDLFESKPPGMFHLAALSLLTTGGEGLAITLQMAIYAAIPGLLGWVGWRETARRRPDSSSLERATIAALGVLCGLLLNFFVEERAGGFQTEGVGSFVACLYLTLFAYSDENMSWKRMTALGGLIFLTIWLKEPFVLPILACSFLLARSLRHWVRGLLVPGLIAGGIELILLFVLGYFPAYLSTYLPAMLGGRLGNDPLEPLYLRGFTFGRLYGNVTTYYIAPLFGYLMAALWLLFPIMKSDRRAKPHHVVTAAAALAIGYLAFWRLFFFLVDWHAAWSLGVRIDPSIFPAGGFATTALLLIFATLTYAASKMGYGWTILANVAALYLCTAAIGISIYANNHFAFAFPLYFTLCFGLMRFAGRQPLTIPVGVASAIALAAGFTYAPNPRQIELLTERRTHASDMHADLIAKVDGLLDACEIERYGALDTYDRLSFAKHSPVGPMFIMHFFEYIGWDHPLIVETQRKLRDEAAVILTLKGADYDRTWPMLGDRFSEAAPDCAKPFLPLPDGMTALFRKAGA